MYKSNIIITKIVNSIKKIKYSFDDSSNSPGVAFYWTIMEIEPKPSNYIYNGYYTITGKSICDYLTNPWVEGFACKGGDVLNVIHLVLIVMIVIQILIVVKNVIHMH